MTDKIYADVSEELVDAILVRCPICNIVYRVMKFNIRTIDNKIIMETVCSKHKSFVYTVMTDELAEKLDNQGIRFEGGQLLRKK